MLTVSTLTIAESQGMEGSHLLTEEQMQSSSYPNHLGKLWQKSQMHFFVLSPDDNHKITEHFAKRLRINIRKP